MAERDRDGHEPIEHDLSEWLAPLFAALIILIAAILAASVLRSGALRPRVGDIVTFAPAARNRDFWHVSVTASLVDEPTRSCILDAGVMAASGGSLIVEGREEQPVLL